MIDIKSKWRPFSETREYIRSLEFNNPREYNEWATTPDRPYDIPSTPHREYKDKGWTTWTDFLGTKLTYEEAREAIKDLGITSSYDYMRKKDTLPRGVPKQPHKTFKNKGWNGWREYLNSKVSQK